jgi:hypothetical protein
MLRPRRGMERKRMERKIEAAATRVRVRKP